MVTVWLCGQKGTKPGTSRLELVERELKEIRMALKATPAGIDGVRVSEHSSSLTTKSSICPDTGPTQVDCDSVAPKSLLQDIRKRMPSKSIGDVELDGQMMGDMLEE